MNEKFGGELLSQVGLRLHRRGRGIEEQRGMKPVLLLKKEFNFRNNEQFLLIKINITFKRMRRKW